MERRGSRLSTALFAATSFEQAARVAVQAQLELARARLAESPWAGAGRILRGIVHLRPADGYRRLLAVDADDASEAPPSLEAIAPSASGWRWVAEHRCAIAIDTNLGAITRFGDGSAVTEQHPTRDSITAESRVRLLAREATHLLLVPLRGPGGSVDGMMSIEADCMAAIDRSFVWPAIVADAQLLADLAAPFLNALPTEAPPETPTDNYLPVIGPSMAPLIAMLRIFAEQDETLLITGPTGSGKSRLARWCHHRSPRRDGPFEILDLATVPEELQLADLFGWKRGAFTGATRDMTGAIARADGGTLFIDEIDKLSLRAQAGLLRVFEERKYRPLGEGTGDRTADVRFIVGTNARVLDLVKAGSFREDLYYRINVLPVQVPSLSERRDEIPDWARYMLARRHDGNAPNTASTAHLAPDALARILQHSWPGNLRQLDNIVRRAYTLSLLEAAGEHRDVTLRAPHVDRAFSLEGVETPSAATGPTLLDQLAGVADAFVVEAQRLGDALKLEHLEALRGLVLAAAVRRLKSKQDAFRLFGKDATVSNRNHGKVLKAELARIDALRETLGLPPDPELTALLSSSADT